MLGGGDGGMRWEEKELKEQRGEREGGRKEEEKKMIKLGRGERRE